MSDAPSAMKKVAAGREQRARAVTQLREALLSGRAWTYGELAALAGCTERTVRNHLDVAEVALGLAITRAQGPDRVVRVRMAESGHRETIDALAHEIAADMLRRIFPVAGTTLDRPARGARAQLVVAVRGALPYAERHLAALRAWLVAASERPRVPLCFGYDGSERGERLVWPLGAVIRDLARVYLVGVPDEAGDARDVRTYALERVVLPTRGPALVRLATAEAGTAPRGMERAVVEHAIDLPFSVFPADDGDTVKVRVRFSAAQARHVRGRTWHRHQREKLLSSGQLEVSFGPANLGEAAAWVRQWGRAVTVLGDERLVEALRENPGPVLPGASGDG